MMDIEDDDFYAPDEGEPAETEQQEPTAPQREIKPAAEDEDLEEGEEEDEAGEEGSDSDIDIITERKDGTKAAPPSQARYNNIRDIPQRTASSDGTVKVPTVKKETPAKTTPPRSTGDLPGFATSKIDVNAKPIYEPARKPITQVNIDDDLPENDKPWRRPGTDISDYFNYGFDEFTWALYASKQESLRSEYDQEKIAQNLQKDMSMMMMGGMGGMSGFPAGAGGAQPGMSMPSMPGMEGMTPEMQQQMQQMMQQMMASGMDPSQMDPSMFMQGGQGASSGQGAGQGGNGNAAFGGQQGFSQGQNSYGGFDQGMNRGNFRGRGRGGNHRW